MNRVSETDRDEAALKGALRGAVAEAVLETAAEGIVTINQLGVIESFNPAASSIFGYPPDEAIGQNVSILMPAPFATEHPGYLKRYLETGKRRIIGFGREVQGRRKDGTVFPLHLAVSEVVLGDRRLFTGIVHDLSDLRAVQHELVKAERLAAVGQMVTAVGHESRNALQRIQSAVEMLRATGPTGDDWQGDLQTVQQAGRELHRLFDDLRAWVEPPRLNRAWQPLRPIWQRAWEAASAVHADRDVRLEAPPAEHDVAAHIDGFRLGQVFRNLFENALEAAVDPVVIRLSLTPGAASGPAGVAIRVRDNGPGFEPGADDHVFDAFFTTKRHGVGMGMAIARRIVESHGGTISARSGPPPGGAEITIELPAPEPCDLQAEEEPPP